MNFFDKVYDNKRKHSAYFAFIRYFLQHNTLDTENIICYNYIVQESALRNIWGRKVFDGDSEAQ